MEITEIKPADLRPEQFIEQKIKEISSALGDGLAVNALSGGVDSSAVTMLGHKALGKRLKTYFIDLIILSIKWELAGCVTHEQAIRQSHCRCKE